MMRTEKKLSVKKMTIVGVLGGISIVLGMTPLGFIPIGPTRATIMHIPVIIGAIMEGPLVGGLIGLIFGMFSVFQAVTNPTPVSFAFINPIVSVVPRILIGIVSYYVYRFVKELGEEKSFWILNAIWVLIVGYLSYGVYSNIVNFKSIWDILINIGLVTLTLLLGVYTNKKLKNRGIDIVMSAVAGTLTNTVGVLFSIYVLYGERFVEALEQNVDTVRKVIVGIGIANGIPEIIIAVIVVTNVIIALRKRIK